MYSELFTDQACLHSVMEVWSLSSGRMQVHLSRHTVTIIRLKNCIFNGTISRDSYELLIAGFECLIMP
jgi:hypothetical protein